MMQTPSLPLVPSQQPQPFYVSKQCTECHNVLPRLWGWGTCSECQERHQERARANKLRLRQAQSSILQTSRQVPSGSVQGRTVSAPRPTNSRLYSHCMSCMKTLGTPPTQTPVCKECIGRTIPNTQIPRQGPSHPLRSVAPLSTQTSVNPMQMQGQAHHRPNHEISRRWPTRPVIPHYNAKGELMPFPNLPLPCYPPVQIPQLAPASALFQANQTSQRKCWRCGISVPAHVIGMTCDDCMAQASAPYVPSNAPPLLSSNLVVANNLSQKKSYSSLAGALSPIQSQKHDRDTSFLNQQSISRGLPTQMHQRLNLPVKNPSKIVPPLDSSDGNAQFASANAKISNQPVVGDARRFCESTGCTNTIPPDTAWRRCTSCSMQRWKARLHGSASSSNVNESSEIVASRKRGGTDASHPVREGKKKEKRRKISSTLVDNKESTGGTDGKSSNTIPGWDSDLTDLPSSEDSDSDSDSELNSVTNTFMTNFKIRIPSLSERQMSGSSPKPLDPWSVPTRACALRSCGRVLPSPYRWKLCEPCRTYRREYQRRRLAGASLSQKQPRERSLSCESEEGMDDNVLQRRPTSPPITPLGPEEPPSSAISSTLADETAVDLPVGISSVVLPSDSPATSNDLSVANNVEVANHDGSSHGTAVTGPEPNPGNPVQPQPEANADHQPASSPSRDKHEVSSTSKRSEATPSPSKSLKVRIPRPTPTSPPKPQHSPTLKSKRTSKPLAKHRSQPLRVLTHSPSYPAYQHLAPLADSLQARLKSFLQTLAYWMRVQILSQNDNKRRGEGKSKVTVDDERKEGEAETSTIATKVNSPFGEVALGADMSAPVVFKFEGEYSIIAMVETQGGETGMKRMGKRIWTIVDEIRTKTGLNFSLFSSLAIETGGTMMRFKCVHRVATAIPPAKSSPSVVTPTANPSTSPDFKVKTMTGELEITIMPDKSHLFFVGQRTIVRFRLVG